MAARKLTEEEYRKILPVEEELGLVKKVADELTQHIIDSIPKELIPTNNGVSLAYDCIANVLVRFMRAYGITEDDILHSIRKANRILDGKHSETKELLN